MIELNAIEQRLVAMVSRARFEFNRLTGHHRIANIGDAAADIDGFGAELAFCKMFKIYPDLMTTERPGYDAKLPNGQTVDIKTTTVENGYLIAMPYKAENPPDQYALMIGTLPKYRFAGFMSAQKLHKEHRLKDFGHGPRHAAQQSELSLEPNL